MQKKKYEPPCYLIEPCRYILQRPYSLSQKATSQLTSHGTANNQFALQLNSALLN